MTQREKDLFYEVLELLRKEVRTSSDFRNRDWKDADDYIFSALHLTHGDIAVIYSGRRGLVYDKSAIEGFYPVCPSYAELLRLHAAYAVGSVTLECELYKSALNDMPCIRAYSIDEGLVQLVLTSADAPQLEEFLGEHITLFYQPARKWKAAEISILGSKADGYVVLYSAKEE